jgi:hypothetical protein
MHNKLKQNKKVCLYFFKFDFFLRAKRIKELWKKSLTMEMMNSYSVVISLKYLVFSLEFFRVLDMTVLI